MTRSAKRILTTHTGSLPRPNDLTELMFARQEGKHVDNKRRREVATRAVRDVVRLQRQAGIDIVSDGEMNKAGFVNYVGERLTGYGGVGAPWTLADMAELPGLVKSLYGGPGGTHINMPRCVGEVHYCGEALVAQDIETLLAALRGDDDKDVIGFLPAASPGCITMSAENLHYGTYEDYLAAVTEAMKIEYRAIVNAGLILQLDCPDIPMGHHTNCWITDQIHAMGFTKYVDLHVSALNHAIAGLPPERVRVHICWGNYAGPHHKDVPLSTLIDSVMKVRVGAISFEGANPRHEHEWQMLKEVKIPEDKVLIPGVIDTKTNVVEHPQLVAQRIERYANIVGRERVIPGTDCGFATFVGFGIVEPEVAWMKLSALAEGARLASDHLWGRSAS
jgi:5-methyltetrahydropteroyltriglutamate--homocysteine methyltransferase